MSRVDAHSGAASCASTGSVCDRIRTNDALKQRFQERLNRAQSGGHEAPAPASGEERNPTAARREDVSGRRLETLEQTSTDSSAEEAQAENAQAGAQTVLALTRREERGGGEGRSQEGPQGVELDRGPPLALDVARVLAQSGVHGALTDGPAARAAADTQALVQWMLDHIPLNDPADRSVTLSFTAATVPVERIVLTRVDGAMHLAITARTEGQDRVRDALKALEERLRSRGLKVGSIRLG